MGLLVNTLQCRCGCCAFILSGKSLSCAACTTAIILQFKVDEMDYLELDITAMRESYTRESKKHMTRKDFLRSMESIELNGRVLREKKPVPLTEEQLQAKRARGVAQHVEHLKLTDGDLNESPVKFTCDECPDKATCGYAFDIYNMNGDCLGSK